MRLAPGYSLIELMFALGLMATLAGIAIPQTLAALDDFRAYGAVRYMSGRLYEARMTAVARTANTAMRFTSTERSYAYAVYLDGNRNGVRSADISAVLIRRYKRRNVSPTCFPASISVRCRASVG